MTISILTLFPEFFEPPLNISILGRAQKQGKVSYQIIDLRRFTKDKRRTVDDRPFGGGPGMVMMVEPIDLALRSLGVERGQKDAKIILFSARGKVFNQVLATQFSQLKHLVLICGHYQDVDQRVADYLVDMELSIGNFVLSGGEPAGLVVADAVSRLIPGVLGNEQSSSNESHQTPGKLSAPQYTRPAEYRGWKVPAVLLSGDHKKIEDWRKTNTK